MLEWRVLLSYLRSQTVSLRVLQGRELSAGLMELTADTGAGLCAPDRPVLPGLGAGRGLVCSLG